MHRLALQRDAERFCGRERELRLLDRVLGDDPPASVVLIHGPGGVGKSTLLREVRRRAELRGFRVATVDGRDAAAAADPLGPAVETLADADRPLLMLDAFERISALGASLRDQALTVLPARARVVIAGRSGPDDGWSQDGWDAVTLELPLAALTDDDARRLLALRGVDDPATADELVRWARGLPLALAVGADAAIARGGTVERRPRERDAPPTPQGSRPAGDRMDTDAQLAATLLRRLAGDELDGADRDVLAVAAIAVAVDARLLAAVLRNVDGDHAETWLRGLSFAELHGTRVALHDRIRAALRRDLTERDPDHERELRRAIADHLHDRALLGEPRLVIDLAALIDDPEVRWGFAGATERHRIDRIRPGDEAAAAAALGVADATWWRGVRRFLTDAPERVAVVREASGRLAGLCVAVTPGNAPAWVEEDAIRGPWIAHARAQRPEGDVLLWRDTLDLSADADRPAESPVVALLNTAASLLCGLPNVRCFYGAVNADDPQARRLSRAIGAVHVPALDVVDGERRVECHVLDHGPGGVIGTARTLVYRDLGLPPPRPTHDGSPGADVVRDALRAYHDPVALAASPLARGSTPSARADSVRTLLRDATVAAFGDSIDARLQRATIERGYLDPDGGHVLAAHELNLSRATYFRRLATAATTVAELVLTERASP